MISSNRVAEDREAVCILNLGDDSWHFLWHLLEERWVVDIGRGFSPLEKLTSWSNEVIPTLVASKSSAVEVLEELSINHTRSGICNLLPRGPNVS